MALRRLLLAFRQDGFAKALVTKNWITVGARLHIGKYKIPPWLVAVVLEQPAEWVLAFVAQSVVHSVDNLLCKFERTLGVGKHA